MDTLCSWCESLDLIYDDTSATEVWQKGKRLVADAQGKWRRGRGYGESPPHCCHSAASVTTHVGDADNQRLNTPVGHDWEAEDIVNKWRFNLDLPLLWPRRVDPDLLHARAAQRAAAQAFTEKLLEQKPVRGHCSSRGPVRGGIAG